MKIYPNPIIYLLFSDSRRNELYELYEEFNELEKIFYPLQKSYGIVVKANTLNHINSLFDDLRTLEGVRVFHFSGHSSWDRLKISEDSLFVNGLSKLLLGINELKLIFLNSCSTDLLARFMKWNSEKCIIATSSNVSDSMARDFSSHFYKSFVEGRSIEDSFQYSCGVLSSKYNPREISPDTITRDSLPMNAYLDDFSWNIYCSNNSLLSLSFEDLLFSTYVDDSRLQKHIFSLIDSNNYVEAENFLELEKKRRPIAVGLINMLHVLLIPKGRAIKHLLGTQVREIQERLFKVIKYADSDFYKATAIRMLIVLIYDYYEENSMTFRLKVEDLMGSQRNWKGEAWDTRFVTLMNPSMKSMKQLNML